MRPWHGVRALADARMYKMKLKRTCYGDGPVCFANGKQTRNGDHAAAALSKIGNGYLLHAQCIV